MNKTLIITGGAGFIGSHVVRLFVNQYPDYRIVNLDKLTYAGNLENLADIDQKSNYVFAKADITDAAQIKEVFERYRPDGVIHLAAESHVDRSISSPMEFIMTNVVGTVNLLNAARALWDGDYGGKRFYHVSTDEVYGSLGAEGFFVETTPYDPRSPYSASKASSDHLVRAYHHTYGMPAVLSNCSNNYGPNHFPEKLIPLSINNIKNSKPIPIYGKGENVRDWLYVEDHCAAVDLILHKGKVGECYNIGGHNERTNLQVVKTILTALGKPESLITYVADRPGHDLRYAIDPAKIEAELGWTPATSFDKGIKLTVVWYLEHRDWWKNILSGEYQNYFEKHYGKV